MQKLIRVTTIPLSLATLLKGQHRFMRVNGFEVVGVSSSGKELEEVLHNEGIRVVEVEMTRTISPLKDLKSLWKLFCYFRTEKPDIIHSITPKAGLLSMLAGKMAGIPIRIHTFTGLLFPTSTGLRQKLLIITDKILCWAATNLYPEGQGVKRDLINYKITSKPLKVIANGSINGIDTSFFSPVRIPEEQKSALKQELNIRKDDVIFVFVGRLVGDKGINELVEAFLKIRQKHQNAKLLLVGWYEPNLDPLAPETIKTIETDDSIIDVGTQADVKPYLAISNCLVFPSYREGFPNVPMQAGAMNLPSIVTNINGCNEIVVNGKTGLIIPPKDTDSLAIAMEYMIANPDEAITMGQEARTRIASLYDQQKVWDALLEEYNFLLKNVR